jgi:hypothetical protein
MHSRYSHFLALVGAMGCAAICLGACSALPAETSAPPTETQGSSSTVAKPPPVPRVVSLWHPGQFQTGIQLYWHTSGTTSQMEQGAARSLNYIVSLGANSVGITFPIYTDGVEPTHVYPGDGTPSMESLAIVLAAAKARGLRVMLRPEIDESNIAAAGNGAWRGSIRPSSTAAWFASYDRLLAGYARLARKYAVNELVAGTELFSLQTYTSRWEQLKSKIRAAGYEGIISYAINWNNWSYVPFRSLGLDAYPSINLGDNATVAQLSAMLEQWLDEEPHSVRTRLTIQEAGIPALSGMYVHPWLWGAVGDTVNLGVQANWFSAVCQAAKAADVQGLYYWMLDSYANPAQPGPDETMSSWLGRPAEQSIRSCFESGHP